MTHNGRPHKQKRSPAYAKRQASHARGKRRHEKSHQRALTPQTAAGAAMVEGDPTAHPQIVRMVEALSAALVPIADIAAETGVSINVLQARYANVIEAGRARSKNRLRSTQLQVALGSPAILENREAGIAAQPARAPNVRMLIHLGGVYLGQRSILPEETHPPAPGSAAADAQVRDPVDELMRMLDAIAQRQRLERVRAAADVESEELGGVEVRAFPPSRER